jgi:8-oxo-(d)GTP phosphatase
MAEAAEDAEIRAAGAVMWRPADAGVEVALVHRARYDDWSFPKGKQAPGEHLLLTAVREVAEETGMHAILGRPLSAARYESSGRPKRVDYWVGRPGSDGRSPFLANDEVDALAWLPLPVARDRLSYPHDLALLDEFASVPVDTVPLVFLRHSAAGHKGDWPGDDLDRPLDGRGVADADRLARVLACFGSCRVISSTAERCVATVRPYAALVGSAVALEPAFTIGPADYGDASAGAVSATGASAAGASAGDVPAGDVPPGDVPPGAVSPSLASGGVAAAAVADIVAARIPALICAHGENLPLLIMDACAALGAAAPDHLSLPKSGFWVLHAAGGTLAAAERHRVPGP